MSPRHQRVDDEWTDVGIEVEEMSDGGSGDIDGSPDPGDLDSVESYTVSDGHMYEPGEADSQSESEEDYSPGRSVEEALQEDEDWLLDAADSLFSMDSKTGRPIYTPSRRLVRADKLGAACLSLLSSALLRSYPKPREGMTGVHRRQRAYDRMRRTIAQLDVNLADPSRFDKDHPLSLRRPLDWERVDEVVGEVATSNDQIGEAYTYIATSICGGKIRVRPIAVSAVLGMERLLTEVERLRMDLRESDEWSEELEAELATKDATIAQLTRVVNQHRTAWQYSTRGW